MTRLSGATHTLAALATFTLEVKKSRFLAQAIAVETPEAGLTWLKQIADPDATHNCWAYRIGSGYRSSDDDEPGGSAGRPILAAIESQGLNQVMVVVTRWYGGINLGVGGLVRAYGGAAAECLRAAARRELIDLVDVELRCAFALSGSLHDLIAQVQGQKLAESFDERGLLLRLRLPASSYDKLAGRLRDLSRGAAEIKTIETTSE
jgi:uncharacterized YigZ family protein